MTPASVTIFANIVDRGVPYYGEEYHNHQDREGNNLPCRNSQLNRGGKNLLGSDLRGSLEIPYK